MFENLQNRSSQTSLQTLQTTSTTGRPTTQNNVILSDQMLGQIQAYKSQLQALTQSPNREQMYRQLINQNPQMQQLVEKANAAYSGDTRAMFYAEAKSRGMSDQQIDALVGQIRQAFAS